MKILPRAFDHDSCVNFSVPWEELFTPAEVKEWKEVQIHYSTNNANLFDEPTNSALVTPSPKRRHSLATSCPIAESPLDYTISSPPRLARADPRLARQQKHGAGTKSTEKSDFVDDAELISITTGSPQVA